MNPGTTALALIALVVFCVIFIAYDKGKRMEVREAEMQRSNREEAASTAEEEKRKALYEENVRKFDLRVREMIGEHIRTLALKWDQTIYQDEYGNYFFDRWFSARDYFINNVLLKDEFINFFSLASHSDSHFFDDLRAERLLQLQQMVSEEVAKYKDENAASESYDVENFTPTQFEFFCAELLKARGWTARLTAATGDQGIDIIANIGDSKAVFQCKKYSQPVGNAAVQEIIAGQRYEQADFAAVVTNSTYTPSARQLAKAKGVHLLHHTELWAFAEKLGVST